MIIVKISNNKNDNDKDKDKYDGINYINDNDLLMIRTIAVIMIIVVIMMILFNNDNPPAIQLYICIDINVLIAVVMNW